MPTDKVILEVLFISTTVLYGTIDHWKQTSGNECALEEMFGTKVLFGNFLNWSKGVHLILWIKW